MGDNNWYRGMQYKSRLHHPFSPMSIKWWCIAQLYTRPMFWPDEQWVDVKSCFGGMAFYYSMQQIIDSQCKYVSFEELLKKNASGEIVTKFRGETVRGGTKFRENVTCEHIPFHF